MKKRKYDYRTRQDAEDAAREKEKMLSVLRLLLWDIASGKPPVQLHESMDCDGDTIQADCYRLDAAHGGIVLVREYNSQGHVCSVSEHYVEDFCHEFMGDDVYHTPARAALRRLAYAMRRAQRDANSRPVAAGVG